MILKCGEQGNWRYKQIDGDCATKMNEQGFFEVTLLTSSGEPLETLPCNQEREYYLMSDRGTTIENLSPIKVEETICASSVQITANKISTEVVETLKKANDSRKKTGRDLFA